MRRKKVSTKVALRTANKTFDKIFNNPGGSNARIIFARYGRPGDTPPPIPSNDESAMTERVQSAGKHVRRAKSAIAQK